VGEAHPEREGGNCSPTEKEENFNQLPVSSRIILLVITKNVMIFFLMNLKSSRYRTINLIRLRNILDWAPFKERMVFRGYNKDDSHEEKKGG